MEQERSLDDSRLEQERRLKQEREENTLRIQEDERQKNVDKSSREENREENLNQYQEVTVGERSERFVDTSSKQLLTSGNLNDLFCFKQGDLVHTRMTAVRQSIYHIRKNWSKFDQFLSDLKQFMEREAVTYGGITDSVKAIFSRKRNWCDLESVQEAFSSVKEEFNVIHTYTTKEGFKEIFKISDSIFRSDSSVNFKEIVNNAVFLVELINIDLFNYIHKYPQFDQFQGIVYRGMALEPSSFNIFESLMDQPIPKRYISIPLGLWSSSTKIEQAVNFVKDELVRHPGNEPLLLEIHVLNLKNDFLDYYHQKFKNKSVVSTICAVPIHEISKYPEEAEVLLRGAFFTAVNFYTKVIAGVEFKVLVLVMLNSNRDHLSTSTLLDESEDREARALFGNMVGVTRNRFIVDYHKKNNLINEDLDQYEIMLKMGGEKLETLMK